MALHSNKLQLRAVNSKHQQLIAKSSDSKGAQIATSRHSWPLYVSKKVGTGRILCWEYCFRRENSLSSAAIYRQTRVYPYPLGAGSARPNPKMGAPDPENPLFPGFSVLRRELRPWSQTMVSEGARPWGRGRSGDCVQTRWVLPKTRWVRFGTQIIGREELTELSSQNSVRTQKLTELGVWNHAPLRIFLGHCLTSKRYLYFSGYFKEPQRRPCKNGHFQGFLLVLRLLCLVRLSPQNLRTRPPPRGVNIPKTGKEGFGVKKLPFPINSEKGELMGNGSVFDRDTIFSRLLGFWSL